MFRWHLVFVGLCAYVASVVFLRVIAGEVQSHEQQLDRLRRQRQERERREALFPVATATPIPVPMLHEDRESA